MGAELALPDVVRWLAEHSRPILLRSFRSDSCIESTAAAIDVLAAFKIAARALPVEVAAFNAPAVEMLDRDMLARDHPDAWDAAGAHSVGIGVAPMPTRPDRFAGHLVAVVAGRWLLDLSLDQASRPLRGLTLGPLLVPYLAEQMATGWTTYETANGTTVMYRRSQIVRGPVWRGAPGWTRAAQRRAIAADLIDAYRMNGHAGG